MAIATVGQHQGKKRPSKKQILVLRWGPYLQYGTDQVTWETEDSLREPLGSVLQLFRVNTFKKKFGTHWPMGARLFPAGFVLRNFCLKLAERMVLNSVCAVTRTRDFELNTDRSYDDYVNRGSSGGKHADSGLNFHTSKGAAIVKTMPGWRPEDTENEGHGVLIKYVMEQRPIDPTPVVQQFLIKTVMELMKGDSRDFDINMPLLDAGLDSLRTVQLINMANKRFGINLDETVTFSFPTTELLAELIIGLI